MPFAFSPLLLLCSSLCFDPVFHVLMPIHAFFFLCPTPSIFWRGIDNNSTMSLLYANCTAHVRTGCVEGRSPNATCKRNLLQKWVVDFSPLINERCAARRQ